jgi:hypothetical protein
MGTESQKPVSTGFWSCEQSVQPVSAGKPVAQHYKKGFDAKHQTASDDQKFPFN